MIAFVIEEGEVSSTAKQEQQYYRRKVWQVPCKLDGSKNKKRNEKNDGNNKRIQASQDTEHKNEPKQELNRTCRERKEIIRIVEPKQLHEIPIMMG